MTIKAIETVYKGYKFRSRLEARWAVFFDALGMDYQYEPEGLNLEECGFYLPDFYIPHINTYLEIKPCVTHLDDWPCHRLFNYIRSRWETERAVQFRFVLLMGEPWLNPQYISKHSAQGEDDVDMYGVVSADGFGYNGFIAGDTYYRWCECPDCGYIGIQFSGRSDRLECKTCYWCDNIKQAHDALCSATFQTGASQAYLDQLSATTRAGCPYHGHDFKTGCPRHGGNKDKGYNAGTPRLLAAYAAARQARFEHGEQPVTAEMLRATQ